MASRSVSECEAEIRSAHVAFSEADGVYRTASARRTDCFNRLNTAQKAFDEAVAGLKALAPSDSDWSSRPRVTGESVV